MKEGKVYSEYLMDWLTPLTKSERRRVRKAARKLAANREESNYIAHVDPRCFSPAFPSGVGFYYLVHTCLPEDREPGYQKAREYISVDELYLRAPGAPVFALAKAGECYRED